MNRFKQVEDTLNNSNDLFLTFRKEMEEMSKKTKRLEKENLNLTRKHDLTNRNILEMAEERTKANKDMENIRRRNTTLEGIVRHMQEQGRSRGTVPSEEVDDEGTESEYGDEYEDDEEGSEEEGDYDDDTEDDAQQTQLNVPTVYGPQPPANTTSQTHVNGRVHRGVNGEVNGIKPSVVT